MAGVFRVYGRYAMWYEVHMLYAMWYPVAVCVVVSSGLWDHGMGWDGMGYMGTYPNCCTKYEVGEGEDMPCMPCMPCMPSSHACMVACVVAWWHGGMWHEKRAERREERGERRWST